MDETTTTDVVTQDTGALDAQPEEQQTEAVSNTDLETTTNDQGSDSDEVSTDDTTASEPDVWSKKGIDISTPEGQAKAAKMYADAQKALTQKAQKASELEKQLTQPDGYDEDRVARIETILKTRDFFDSNPEAREMESAMAEYINNDATGAKRELIKQGYLSLDEVYAIVSANPNRTSQLKSEGRKEGLQELANKQRATAVNGSANNAAPAPRVTSENVEQWWDSLGSAGRADPANRAKLDSLL